MQRTNRRARRPKTARRHPAAALADPERDLLRYIVEHADLLDVVTDSHGEPTRLRQQEGGGYTEVSVPNPPVRWILIPMHEDVLAQLAAFEADREDLEDCNDLEADDCDVEHTLTEETEQGTRLRQMKNLGGQQQDDDEDGHDHEGNDGDAELSVVRPDTMSRAGIVDEASIALHVAMACDGVPIINETLGAFRRL